MTKMVVLSIFMMLVTIPSRILPIFFLSDRKLPPVVNSFLYYVSYAVLGALIFPDILTSTGDILSSCAGAVTALILAWFGRDIIIVLAGGILASYLAHLL
ncbi:MAG: AzlD domain-containing protein [Synergistaceae bacterium]|nr:AzlD domain-containing protein [Synergistaceae bacterium]